MRNILFLLSIFSSFSPAQEFEGVKMTDTLDVEGKTLLLNGMGLREAKVVFFPVSVYVAGLYLERRSSDAKAILNSPQEKYMQLHFTRSVSAKDIQGAWKDCLQKNCSQNCPDFSPQFKILENQLEALSEHEILAIKFAQENLALTVKGKRHPPIPGKEFAQEILGCWLGKNPPNDKLKAGLLGLISATR